MRLRFEPRTAAARHRLLPRNMQAASFATGVMPLIAYSGMNTTDLKQGRHLL
ncbi:hypothetical protein [Xanthomonas nasturtii]|uniref:Uncharacterized protein n=1 Tax=Xanthomonas nasturtii TaxID=1843581 RepID=A0ABT0LKI5_9XANT|nr:hypothetical protein [Xanthomonas nasturtii]MCL1497770.1 hypothetical protein [Xanthomonas nasturtii]MCL1502467.1 hypothetical protein [Xanthomonas nasturtii]MCL1525579.1 hypothetical protein [Xanthomonas nasturtii]MCL1529217.1 hypothetical protein [Xanthomonas nasturtii]MCL1533287.1 hypothetical protein [Xanthomonas nasturtii]